MIYLYSVKILDSTAKELHYYLNSSDNHIYMFLDGELMAYLVYYTNRDVVNIAYRIKRKRLEKKHNYIVIKRFTGHRKIFKFVYCNLIQQLI